MNARRSAFVAVCALLTGCRVSTGPDGELILAVTPARTSVIAGQPLTVEILATSTGDAPVTFYAPYCASFLEVRAADGTKVEEPSGVICAAVLVGPVTLQSGESRKFTTVWHTRAAPQAFPSAPGAYVLQATNFRVRGARVEHLPATVTVTN